VEVASFSVRNILYGWQNSFFATRGPPSRNRMIQTPSGDSIDKLMFHGQEPVSGAFMGKVCHNSARSGVHNIDL